MNYAETIELYQDAFNADIIHLEMDDKEEQRTITQNAAMHKYFELLATALNDAGLDMKAVLKPEVDIPWTKESVKNHLWRPIQKIMMDKESTTEMNTTEPNDIYLVLDRHLAKTHGISVPWPSNRSD